IQLDVIGDIQDKKYFKKLKKYDFVNHIPFQTKEKLIEHFRKSDIYVMPSITETFGLTYAEAISQGLPVIYSKGQGFDKQFDEGMVGYGVISKNEKDIANKIQLILKNYSVISRNCVELVDKYSWDTISLEY